MIEDNYIDYLKKKFDEIEEIKNKVIEKSIRITRLSKSIIYSLIRNDINSAERYIKDIKKEIDEISKYYKEYPQFYPNISIAFQEYSEAMIFYEYIINKRIPKHYELGVDEFSYINGLMDFVGELSRKATEEMINDNIEFSLEAKKIIEDIYMKMLYMEFKNFDLRKKVDYVANVLNFLNEKIFYKKK